MRFVFTGGHHNSALELATTLRDELEAEIVWFGHKHTSLKNENFSAEYHEVTAEDITFVDIKAGKVYKTKNIMHLLRVPFGFLQSLYYLFRYRPKLIVSFGGYLAVPVVIAGWLLGIPSVTHEQTTVIGLANKVIGRFAKKVFITWPSSKNLFPKDKVTLAGLPLREAIFKDDPGKFNFENNLPTIYITAGKQGSHVINEAVMGVLPEILKQCNVIHQCGSHSEYQDLEELTRLRSELPGELKIRYIVKDYIYREEIGSAFSRADFLICRAGAHTTYEIAALGKPAILIPIPWVSHNEQLENALVITDRDAGELLEQKDLTGERLLDTINLILSDYEMYKDNADQLKDSITFNATEVMLEQIQEMT